MNVNKEGLLEVGRKSLAGKIKKYPEFFDAKQTFLRNEPNIMVSPLFKGTRLEYQVVEFDVLMDSSNMNPGFFKRIAQVIVEKEEEVDCIIIIHGTNTMEYTASVLSFMLNNLNKTIVITGSQVPLSGEVNDAFGNLLGSFRILANFFIPEVCIYFHNKLMRGNRTRKISSTTWNGFDSTIPPLIETDIHFTINYEYFLSRKIHKSLEVWSEISEDWIFIKLTPLTTQAFLDQILTKSSFRCVIIDSKSGFDSCYDDFYLLHRCRQLVKDGKIIFMLTNFEEENNIQVDRVHQELTELGVIMDNSITVGAALAKTSVLLGKFQDKSIIQNLLRSDLKGETDLSKEEHSLTSQNPNIIKKLLENVQNLKNTEIEVFTNNIQFELEMRLLESGQSFVIDSVSGLTKFSTPNNRGETALHFWVLKKDVLFLEILGKMKVDFNLLDKKGNSCLFLCLRERQYKKCTSLIKFGAKFVANQKQLTQMVIKAIKDGDAHFFQ